MVKQPVYEASFISSRNVSSWNAEAGETDEVILDFSILFSSEDPRSRHLQLPKASLTLQFCTEILSHTRCDATS